MRSRKDLAYGVIDTLRDKILKLPVAERAKIAIGLYESIVSDPNNELTAKQLVELEFRLNTLRERFVANGD